MCVRGGWAWDPPVQLSADALKTYARVGRAGMLSSAVSRHLSQAGSALALRPKPWTQVNDPIAALILTAARIDIRFDGPWKVLKPSGVSWDVRDAPPGFFAQRARFAARSVSDKLALSRLGSAAAWEGEVFGRWPVKEQRSFKGLVIGSHRCQRRLAPFSAGRLARCFIAVSAAQPVPCGDGIISRQRWTRPPRFLKRLLCRLLSASRAASFLIPASSWPGKPGALPSSFARGARRAPWSFKGAASSAAARGFEF